MLASPRPRAIFGGPLEGFAPVRYIYVDEAGTAANEPVTVVVGIVVHADTQWLSASECLRALRDSVPDRHREGFILHAKSIWGNPKYREGWELKERVNFLQAAMSIPRLTGIAVAYGIAKRSKKSPINNLSPAKYDHMRAFEICIAKADECIRSFGQPGELATVIAEDVPEIKRLLRWFVQFLKEHPLHIPAVGLTRTDAQIASGEFADGTTFQVERVVDAVHFVSKADGPLLQIANSCAFGMRRFYSEQSYGADFARAIFANLNPPDLDTGLLGGFCHR